MRLINPRNAYARLLVALTTLFVTPEQAMTAIRSRSTMARRRTALGRAAINFEYVVLICIVLAVSILLRKFILDAFSKLFDNITSFMQKVTN